MLGWTANVLLVLCAANVHRHRWALLAGAAGGGLWLIKAVGAGWWDLAAIEILLSLLQLRGWWKWTRN
jgi:hypothetical protein